MNFCELFVSDISIKNVYISISETFPRPVATLYLKFRSEIQGKSKRASALVAAVEKATDNFIERGEQIANENPDIKQEMLEAVDEVRKHGNAMSSAAREFSEDPCSSLKRGNMVRASRSLLSAVTRLLILADMVDVHLLLKSLHVVEDDLSKLQNASSQDELLNNMKVCVGRNEFHYSFSDV